MRRVMRWAALAAVAAVAASGVRADDTKVEGDLKKMQGTWVNAKPDDAGEVRWVFESETLKASVHGSEYTCKVTLDPKATPHPSADIVIKDGPGDSAGKTSKAIYKFDGDGLVFCVTSPGGDNRPTEFKTAEGETFLFELKRDK